MQAGTLLGIGLAAAGLCACAAPAVQAPKGTAQAGAFAVAHEGVSYQARLAAGRPGKALTRAGAVAVPGLTLRVAPFAGDQGKRAKDVAALACAQAGGRFQPQAIGGYAAGAWIFEGGCA
ncbi:hypothetical protein KM031_03010 [Gemmobacter fulvus]|uniref:Lipoprotein n=1 Tax=Gemmobacter fulvus TaxID=2840474 RepID=A0A975P6S4_9RHOB|nr:hypothetical protein [Gemmobacter fulvus]MBT9243983.1 hypothetical protein [Gemmobacter fulvus]QWK90895.1 hypothetical protein KM031_03010 [Gemmobacter fulvus]